MDITLSQEGELNPGIEATALVARELEGRDGLRDTVLLLKEQLELKDLNKSYLGGFSSYAIFLMVLACMNYLNKDANKITSSECLKALVDFYTSRRFDPKKNVIGVGANGVTIRQVEDYPSTIIDPNLPLKIIDPTCGRQIRASFTKLPLLMELFADIRNHFAAINESMRLQASTYQEKKDLKAAVARGEEVEKLLILLGRDLRGIRD